MPTNPSPSQAAASRANGAASRGPVTDAGKARAARNGTSHGLRGGDFCLLPGENGEELALLERAVAADWHPRDAFERHWAAELVAAMWRQQRLRRLELKALATADAEEVISDASLKRLQTLGRYGSRLDADIGRALRALRVLKNRATTDLAESPQRTFEPERAAPPPTMPTAPCTFEPEDPELACSTLPLNRHERRRREALARKGRLAA
jgi:hypothetical protein